ncbi:hypothetical protein AAY473_010123 [Plecturocebus cupreus]
MWQCPQSTGSTGLGEAWDWQGPGKSGKGLSTRIQGFQPPLASERSLWHQGWSTVAQSQLTAASVSQVQGICPTQPPKVLGLQA